MVIIGIICYSIILEKFKGTIPKSHVLLFCFCVSLITALAILGICFILNLLLLLFVRILEITTIFDYPIKYQYSLLLVFDLYGIHPNSLTIFIGNEIIVNTAFPLLSTSMSSFDDISLIIKFVGL